MRNYTSSVPASRSMENIEQLLVNLGCLSVSRFYEEKEVSGFFFQLNIKGEVYSFKLPAKVHLIYKQLTKDKVIKSDSQRIAYRKQAARTAWKTLFELVQIQTDLIMLEQSDALEAFLPYAFDGQMTLRERMDTADGVKLLGEAKSNTIELAEYSEVKG